MYVCKTLLLFVMPENELVNFEEANSDFPPGQKVFTEPKPSILFKAAKNCSLHVV